MNENKIDGILARVAAAGIVPFVPTLADVESLEVGDSAPFCFGWSRVVSIAYRGTDVNGKAFVGYDVIFGHNATISESIKQDRLVRSVALTRTLNSAECDALERHLLLIK